LDKKNGLHGYLKGCLIIADAYQLGHAVMIARIDLADIKYWIVSRFEI
jgi:hypothetical protein